MSRSKHTDPKAIRAARRLRAPYDRRGVGDLSQRRNFGREGKPFGAAIPEKRRRQNHPARLRFIMQKPRAGFHHPAGKRDVFKVLKTVGPLAFYGISSIELAQAPAGGSIPVFGRYAVAGRLVLFAQPTPPWRLPGFLKSGLVRRLERAGAVVTRVADVGATLVDWPKGTLRRFMLEEVLLHELGHHILQHHKAKRLARVARTRDHEAFAARFAEKQRLALMKGRRH